MKKPTITKRKVNWSISQWDKKPKPIKLYQRLIIIIIIIKKKLKITNFLKPQLVTNNPIYKGHKTRNQLLTFLIIRTSLSGRKLQYLKDKLIITINSNIIIMEMMTNKITQWMLV